MNGCRGHASICVGDGKAEGSWSTAEYSCANVRLSTTVGCDRNNRSITVAEDRRCEHRNRKYWRIRYADGCCRGAAVCIRYSEGICTGCAGECSSTSVRRRAARGSNGYCGRATVARNRRSSRCCDECRRLSEDHNRRIDAAVRIGHCQDVCSSRTADVADTRVRRRPANGCNRNSRRPTVA